MKKTHDIMQFVLSALIAGSGGWVLQRWISGYSSWTLREHLKGLSPLLLEINFMVLVATAVLCFVLLRKAGAARVLPSGIPRAAWIVVCAVAVAGLMIVVFVVPREHRIYYDEDIYQNIAQNIACTKGAGSGSAEDFPRAFENLWKGFVGQAGMCNEGKNEYGEYSCLRLEYNKEPNGWPYLLSVVFRVFGVHERAAFFANNAVFLMSVFAVFFIGTLLFGQYRTGMCAAIVFACTPEVLIWSNTVAVEPSAALFPALAVLSTLFFLKIRSTSSLFLCAAMTAFAVQFRPEAMMICAVNGLLLLFGGRDELKRGRLYLAAAVFFVLIIPHIAHLYAVKDLGWGSTGPKFGMKYFQDNVRVNLLFYVKNLRFPVLFTLLCVPGLVLQSGGSRYFQLREKMVVVLWLLLFWGIFVFFYAGSYNYGADVRFSLLSAIPLSLLAGHGAACVTGALAGRKTTGISADLIMVSALGVFFLSFLPFVRAVTQEAWAARADHRYARDMAGLIPQDAIVLTHNPNMFLLWGKNAAQASLATEQSSYFKRFFYRYKGGVYFHYNFWCNVNDQLQNSFCNNILKRFDCTQVAAYKEKNYRFELYKVERKPVPGTKRP